MARRDVRLVRDEAARAAAEGKHRKAVECYLELEQLEPTEPNWPKRAAESYRRLDRGHGQHARQVAPGLGRGRHQRPGAPAAIDRERHQAHAATLGAGRVGVLHGSKSYVLTHADDARVGQIAEAHSISAGLDYPGVGPEHAHWRDVGRARYVSRTDAEALAALQQLARTEGILCALETAHAIAAVAEVAAEVGPDGVIVVNLSGRGDKDMITVARQLGVSL